MPFTITFRFNKKYNESRSSLCIDVSESIDETDEVNESVIALQRIFMFDPAVNKCAASASKMVLYADGYQSELNVFYSQNTVNVLFKPVSSTTSILGIMNLLHANNFDVDADSVRKVFIDDLRSLEFIMNFICGRLREYGFCADFMDKFFIPIITFKGSVVTNETVCAEIISILSKNYQSAESFEYCKTILLPLLQGDKELKKKTIDILYCESGSYALTMLEKQGVELYKRIEIVLQDLMLSQDPEAIRLRVWLMNQYAGELFSNSAIVDVNKEPIDLTLFNDEKALPALLGLLSKIRESNKASITEVAVAKPQNQATFTPYKDSTTHKIATHVTEANVDIAPNKIKRRHSFPRNNCSSLKAN